MVKVTLWGSLRAAADGQCEIEVEGDNTRQVLTAISHKHPALAPIIEAGVSVAIDGLIYKEAWFTPIKPDSEVVLMPYMQGG